MKTLLNIIFIAVIIAAFYFTIDTLFELYPDRQIVYGFCILVCLTILYFSFRLCFAKEDKLEQ